jgi:hypothetical protein
MNKKDQHSLVGLCSKTVNVIRLPILLLWKQSELNLQEVKYGAPCDAVVKTVDFVSLILLLWKQSELNLLEVKNDAPCDAVVRRSLLSKCHTVQRHTCECIFG